MLALTATKERRATTSTNVPRATIAAARVGIPSNEGDRLSDLLALVSHSTMCT